MYIMMLSKQKLSFFPAYVCVCVFASSALLYRMQHNGRYRKRASLSSFIPTLSTGN